MTPRLTILLQETPLAPPPEPVEETGLYGALVDFHGLVRGEENGVRITALEYQAYRPMAQREMERIAGELLERSPCHAVYIAHRFGIVPVGEAAITIRALARHRGEAFSFVTSFMDRLKADVPIWKVHAIPAQPATP